MAAPQIVPLPPFFQMGDGMRVRVTAIDATTGSLVTGVVVSGVSIDVDTDDGDGKFFAQPNTAALLPGPMA
jgi:hypothetical protein